MRFGTLAVSLPALLTAIPGAAAVYEDEVGHIDFHHALLGLPQESTAFFYKPRPDERASLLYTLSDVGVLGAVHPNKGSIVWRQLLNATSTGGGHLRPAEGLGWVCSAIDSTVQAWNAVTGRNIWSAQLHGQVRDMEIMEMTESPDRKDVLALFDVDGSTVLHRLDGNDGHVTWEFKETTGSIPLQVSNSIDKVFIIALNGSPGSHGLRVINLDPATGKKLDEQTISSKEGVTDSNHVMFVGANSASPVVAWSDATYSKLRVNVLGTKTRQDLALAPGTVDVKIHAPHLIQSQPHFLVHSRTLSENRAEVYHIDIKTGAISKAYELPQLPGKGAFSTSSTAANTYFTRITEDEISVTASDSHGVLGRWPLAAQPDAESSIYQAVSDVVKKGDDSLAVQAAGVAVSDDWVLLRNGKQEWLRHEGLTGAIAAIWSEIPESRILARSLEREAHSSPLLAYLHRLERHVADLQYLPAYLQTIPQRVLSSLVGSEDDADDEALARDSFGFHRIIVLATRRGRLYGLDSGAHGKVLWSRKVKGVPTGSSWDIRGLYAHDTQALVRGAEGEYFAVDSATGELLTAQEAHTLPEVSSTVLVNDFSGARYLLSIRADGTVGKLPVEHRPQESLVVRDPEGSIRGIRFLPDQDDDTAAVEQVTWIFSPPPSQRIVTIATRPAHDPVASIGRVLGDRSVKYKYLNPNTMVIAAVEDSSNTLTVYLLDTVSGEVLTSTNYHGVDPAKPISAVMAENWFVVSFFGEHSLTDGTNRTIKGYQLVVSDLYESELANDRGPLGDNTQNTSSWDPIDLPTSPPRPAVVSQSFVLSQPIEALTPTQTRQGITSRAVLAYLPESHSIATLYRAILEPRRPVGRDPTPAEAEAEGLLRYVPNIEIDPRSIITHRREVVGVKEIVAAPAVVESTSLVFAYGIDIFGTRVAPSMVFDILGKNFDKLTLVATVVALMVGVVALGPLVRRKQIDLRWKTPM